MKRSRPLARRRTPLRTRATRRLHGENLTQKAAWKTPHAGPCQCGCDRWAMRLENHHIIAAEYIKREHRADLLWDPRNALGLSPFCHAQHTSGMRRILVANLPDCALEFAVDLFGEQRAALYLARTYREART